MPPSRNLSQAGPDTVANAELEAVEEMSGYLRRYMIPGPFLGGRQRPQPAARGDVHRRHRSVPSVRGTAARWSSEKIRKERYDRAIKWLEGVQSGRIVPDLPLVEDTDSSSAAIGISFHSAPKLNH